MCIADRSLSRLRGSPLPGAGCLGPGARVGGIILPDADAGALSLALVRLSCRVQLRRLCRRCAFGLAVPLGLGLGAWPSSRMGALVLPAHARTSQLRWTSPPHFSFTKQSPPLRGGCRLQPAGGGEVNAPISPALLTPGRYMLTTSPGVVRCLSSQKTPHRKTGGAGRGLLRLYISVCALPAHEQPAAQVVQDGGRAAGGDGEQKGGPRVWCVVDAGF